LNVSDHAGDDYWGPEVAPAAVRYNQMAGAVNGQCPSQLRGEGTSHSVRSNFIDVASIRHKQIARLVKGQCPSQPRGEGTSHSVRSEFIDVAACGIRGHKQVLGRRARANQTKRSQADCPAE